MGRSSTEIWSDGETMWVGTMGTWSNGEILCIDRSPKLEFSFNLQVIFNQIVTKVATLFFVVSVVYIVYITHMIIMLHKIKVW